MNYRLVGLLIACALASASFASEPPRKGVDVWVYRKGTTGWSIFYGGQPIHFLPHVGDGAWDRPTNDSPEHRYVFIDAALSVQEAGDIVGYWGSFDPRTPSDFIAVTKFGYYRYLSRFITAAVPPDAFKQSIKLLDSEAEYRPDGK
jgi:hypothetical protein